MLMRLLRQASTTALCLLVQTTAFSQSDTGHLRVRVVNVLTKAAVPDATLWTVRLQNGTWSESGPQASRSNSEGVVDCGDVAPGDYELWAGKSGLTMHPDNPIDPYRKPVRIHITAG